MDIDKTFRKVIIEYSSVVVFILKFEYNLYKRLHVDVKKRLVHLQRCFANNFQTPHALHLYLHKKPF
ncbi:hypothetical protein T4D_7313 [Trichinella pseudospiralis]|uniref:Uncharacterized protein n=1 Tax=Trichinella pseudospiralis TaxID=6337 RepID=A0A0V1FIE9_TRIPS|nr:hypothetical protein T4D_7313 [Trichinella pseudospiralis]